MKLARFEHGSEFLAATESFLLKREVAHFLLLALPLRPVPAEPALRPYFAAVFDGPDVVAAAVRTPPHSLVLSHIDVSARDAALAMIRDDLRANAVSIPLVGGPVGVADGFANEWAASIGGTASVVLRFREFDARSIEPPRDVPGALRVATLDDLDLIHRWVHAFIDDTGLPEEDRILATRESVLRRIERAMFWLWCVDDATVTMASIGGTPRVPRIGGVYTSPALRRRGYASALVAALSQRKLDEGCVCVSLSTDLANPTSNRIYQAVGFRPVSDSIMLRVNAP